MHHYYANIVGTYWPPERRYIDEKYQTIPFPFAEMPAREFSMKTEWDLSEFMGYLGTWSATQQFLQKNEQNPLDMIHRALAKVWGQADLRQAVRWPLHLRLGRVTVPLTSQP